jgi:hypothetical protein
MQILNPGLQIFILTKWVLLYLWESFVH